MPKVANSFNNYKENYRLFVANTSNVTKVANASHMAKVVGSLVNVRGTNHLLSNRLN